MLRLYDCRAKPWSLVTSAIFTPQAAPLSLLGALRSLVIDHIWYFWRDHLKCLVGLKSVYDLRTSCCCTEWNDTPSNPPNAAPLTQTSFWICLIQVSGCCRASCRYDLRPKQDQSAADLSGPREDHSMCEDQCVFQISNEVWQRHNHRNSWVTDALSLSFVNQVFNVMCF